MAVTMSGVVAVAPARAAVGCLTAGTEATINAALTGPGAVVELCPGAVFDLHNSVTFTAPNQQLRTQGLPTDGSRALLRVASSGLTTAIRGHDQSGVVVENIQVDGSRPQFGPRPSPANALIELGGHAVHQTVRNIVARNTRGWSTIHIFEGHMVNSTPVCQDAQIHSNEVGPAGHDDGTIADGISLACGNSLVQGNVIRDATDGAIVIFGAPGSHIRFNTVVNETKELLSAIHMVVHKNGFNNYRDTWFDSNVIDAKGAYIRIAVAMGSRVWGWCDRPDEYNVGGRVTNNVLRGLYMGYGFAVAGVSEFTVTGNIDQSRHVGIPQQGCGGAPTYPTTGFLYYPPLTSNSTLQPEFRSGNVSDRMFRTSLPPILRVPVRPSSSCGILRSEEGLYPEQSMFSCDGRFEFRMQADGNLVLTQRGVRVLWTSNTAGLWAAQAWMQSDGNFVVLSGGGWGLFHSNTFNRPGAWLQVQNDGNVVVYDAANRPLWATNTCCR